jgi:hypothetical protein
MYLVLFLLGTAVNVSAQASSNIEFSTTNFEPNIVNVQTGAMWWWVGGDGSSPVILSLMQGCDPSDATTVEAMASGYSPSKPLVPPNSDVAGAGSEQFQYQRSLQWNPSRYPCRKF